MIRQTARRHWLVPLCLTLLLGGLALPAQAARAATPRHVTDCGDAGANTLRGQIAAAAGDTIVFDQDCTGATTIKLTTGTWTLGQNVTIDGTGHTVIVDGGCMGCDPGGTPSGGVHVFAVNFGVTANLIALTIQHGYSTSGGGGIYSQGTLTVANCTLSGNRTGGFSDGGGIDNYGAVTLTNTIVANSRHGGDLDSEVFGATFSGNDNLIDDGTSAILTGTGNLNQPPLLGTLGSYGGSTQTLPLLPGSPAIDAGDDPTCAASGNGAVNMLDQRGIARTQGAHCDIGAFESQGFTLTGTSGDMQGAFFNTFPAPLAVTVSSAHSEPVAGGQVTFTAPPASGPTATFTGNPATISGSSASVTATANGTASLYTVTVSAAGAPSVSFNLTNSPPTLIGVSPGSGSTVGGSRVTLTGVGFDTAATMQVLLDGTALPAANLVSATSTQIVYMAPAHGAGSVTMTVTANGAPLVGSVTYQYGSVSPLPPPKTTGTTDGQAPNALPGPRPAGTTGGPAPNPLPLSRP
jgi:hypothetical protein